MANKAEEKKERSELHVVQDELRKLGKDFSRFNERLRKLEAHIGQAHEDVSAVRNASEKIAARFGSLKNIG